jgi:VanZ family protein
MYAAAIFIFSSISKPPKALTLFPHSDKALHLIEYAIFGFLMIRALCSLKLDKSLLFLRITAVVIVLFYGFTDEIHQYFVPGRDMDIFDCLSNGLGALVGQVFFRKAKTETVSKPIGKLFQS